MRYGPDSARERPHLRRRLVEQRVIATEELVLRGLGWNIIRVWSTDWWFDPKGAAERLHNTLSALLEDWRHTSTDQPTSDETPLRRLTRVLPKTQYITFSTPLTATIMSSFPNF
jgi:hypothetical protein